jgi:DNA-directed RNA polymerase alpha subunit
MIHCLPGFFEAKRGFYIRKPNPPRVLADVDQSAYKHVLDHRPFSGRGLSNRTIEALIASAIDAPERLLFMTPAQLRDILGIGKASLAEIMKYRSRFLPE